MMSDLRCLAEALRPMRSLTLASHVAPDGDTVGAACALALAFERQGKRVVRFCADPIPERLRFLKGSDLYTRDPREAASTDCVFCIDTAGPGRVGSESLLGQGKPVFVIDHHVSNEGFGTLNVVSRTSSVSETVLELLDLLEVPIDREIADCLYTGLATDTGRFSYADTTGETLRKAARCIDAGADYSGICFTQFQQRTLAATRLLGDAIRSLELFEDGRICIMTVTPQDMEACGGRQEDMEGIVNYANEILGVEIGALLYPRNGQWKVSLRANGLARLDRLAVRLHGGGHAKAAGGVLDGTAEEAKKELLALIRETEALG